MRRFLPAIASLPAGAIAARRRRGLRRPPRYRSQRMKTVLRWTASPTSAALRSGPRLSRVCGVTPAARRKASASVPFTAKLTFCGMSPVTSAMRCAFSFVGEAIPDNLRWGVYAVFEGETDYARRCFSEYGVATDPSGRYAALWRPYHFIGLELGVSVASAALRREPTGCAEAWRADVVAVAKRPLRAGEVLDGEGGATVWGKCIPATRSRALGGLPIGLAHGVTLRRDVAPGAILSRDDVALDAAAEPVRIRAAMEAAFA